MSELEVRSKELLLDAFVFGTAMELDREGAEVVTRWMLKNAIVACDTGRARNSQFFSAAVRQGMVNAEPLPDGTHLWLARTEPPTGGVYISLNGEANLQNLLPVEMNVLTFGVAFLLLQLISFRSKRTFRGRHHYPLPLEQGPAWEIVSIPVWPFGGKRIRWPPAASLNSQDHVRVFARRASSVLSR